jgi:AraC-binding-like domain
LHISEVTGGSVDVHRTPSIIRMSDPGLVKVGVQVHGRGLIAQHDRETVLAPGDFAIYETSHPYTLHFDDHFTMFVLMIPRDRLRLQTDLTTLTAVPIRRDDGLGSLVSPLLYGLRQGLSKITPCPSLMFEDAVVDLISATLDCYTSQTTSLPEAAIGQLPAKNSLVAVPSGKAPVK